MNPSATDTIPPVTDTTIRDRAHRIAREVIGENRINRIAPTLINVARAAGREAAERGFATVASPELLEPVVVLWSQTKGVSPSSRKRAVRVFLRNLEEPLLAVLRGMDLSEWGGVEAAIRLACQQHTRSRKTLDAPVSMPAPARRGRA